MTAPATAGPVADAALDEPSAGGHRGVRLGVALGVAVLLFGLLVPLLPLVVWTGSATWRFPDLVPSAFSARTLRLVADPSTGVVGGIVASTAIAGAVALVAGLIGLASGRALGLHEFRGKRLVQFLVLAPVIVPALAATLGIHVVFIRMGLANRPLGVGLVHLIPTIPYVTLVMAATYTGYDVRFEEQARTLGASAFQTFRRVTLPQVWPGLVVGCLFAFLISYSEYVLTLLIGGGRVQTLPILLFQYLRTADTSLAAAVALVFFAPALVLLAVTSRYLSGSSAISGFGRL